MGWENHCLSANAISLSLHLYDSACGQLFVTRLHLGCGFCIVVWCDRIRHAPYKFLGRGVHYRLCSDLSMEEPSVSR